MGDRELEEEPDEEVYYNTHTELSTDTLDESMGDVNYDQPFIEAETCLGTPVHPEVSGELSSQFSEPTDSTQCAQFLDATDLMSPSMTSEIGNSVQVSDPSKWIDDNSKTLFSLGCVKKYFLSPKGVVETSVKEESLKIFQLNQKVEIEGVVMPDVFLQIGDWYYPLVPNVSPFLKDGLGAYLFPDIRNPGSSVAVTLPWQTAECFNTILRTILFPEDVIHDEENAEKSEEKKEEEPYVRQTDDVDDMCVVLSPTVESVTRGITTGAALISQSLVSAAERASKAMSDMTPKIIQNMSECQEVVHVDASVLKGVEDVEKVCQQAALVTGYVSNQLGQATAALGEFLARRQSNCLSATGSQGVADTVQILTGAAEGMAIVYSGLHRFSSILASSLADNTVKVVGHKYGPEVERVTRSTLNFLGNLIQTASNMKLLSPRTTVRRIIEQVGRAKSNNLPQISEH